MVYRFQVLQSIGKSSEACSRILYPYITKTLPSTAVQGFGYGDFAITNHYVIQYLLFTFQIDCTQ